MTNVDQIIHARWIVPVEPEGVVLENHAIVVNDSLIIDICTSESAHQRYHATSVQECPQHILMPGFVNAHTHTSMNLLRGLADDQPLMQWLEKTIWPAEQRCVDAQFVEVGSQLAIAEMLRGGTTCFNDNYFFPEVTAEVADHMGIRASLGTVIMNVPTQYAATADEYIEKGMMLHTRYRKHARITTNLTPHAPYTVDDQTLSRVAELADELNLQVQMHIHESAFEIQNSLETYGMRPMARLEKLGLLSNRLQAVHMTQVDDQDLALLKEYHVHVVHCPESNLKLASGFCPIGKLVGNDLNVALGTDGSASNNDLDMFGEMRTAALLAKAVANDATAIPASTALKMATLNGAKALGLDHITGSIKVGKSADFIAVSQNELEALPLYHPISQLVYATNRHQVTDVWVAGKHLLHKGQLMHVDEQALRADVNAMMKKILDQK
jgi:5-methylthioadenosine/S-adenosylhomocysteine deaminase